MSVALAASAVLHEVEVRDADALGAVFAEAQHEVVFHLAAQIDVRYSVEHPAGDADANVLGAIAVLEAARACGARRVVNTSTGGGLSGDADVIPTPEDHPIRPLAPYGQAKYAAEGYCEPYTRLHDLATVSLRYGNVYGPRQDVHGEAGVVAIFCGCLIDNRTPTVFGDGRQTLDWIEVSDVVSANLLAADSNLTGPINIGHGQETAVLELIAALDEVSAGAMPEPPVRARAAGRGPAKPPRCRTGQSRAGVGATRWATSRARDNPRQTVKGRSQLIVSRSRTDDVCEPL